MIRALAQRSDVLIENFRGRSAREVRPRLRDPPPAQPGPRLLLDHRLRAGRAVRRPARLRRRLPGHERHDERLRDPRRGARRRPDEGRHLDDRHPDRAVRRQRDPRRTSSPRGRQAGPASTSTCRCSTAASHRCPTTRRTTWSRAWPRPGAATAASAASPPRPSCAPTARRSSSSPARPGSGRALAKVIGRPELAYDERFATVSARIANRDLVLRTLDEAFRTRSASDWIPELESADVPVSPVNDLDGVFANPQVRHRGLRTTVDHPVSGQVDLLRNPIRMSGTPDRGLPHSPDARASTPTRSSQSCWAWGRTRSRGSSEPASI